jgi:hypothetical protein
MIHILATSLPLLFVQVLQDSLLQKEPFVKAKSLHTDIRQTII